jgi:DNA-nicking Smr family endonuclease
MIFKQFDDYIETDKMKESDIKLWQAYIANVKPLQSYNNVTSLIPSINNDNTKKEKNAEKTFQKPFHFTPLYKPSYNIQKVHQITTLDRASVTKIDKGIVQISAKLDLHGLTLDHAHHVLYNFIFSCYQKKMRCLLIITGKGTSSKNREPVLKQYVPAWLETQNFIDKISSITPALPKHGGEGAFYVYLKKQIS